MSSISEWTGLVVRDSQQGRQEVTVPWATGTATPTSHTGTPRTRSLSLALAREDAAAAARRVPDISFTPSVAPRDGVVYSFLTGHLQP